MGHGRRRARELLASATHGATSRADIQRVVTEVARALQPESGEADDIHDDLLAQMTRLRERNSALPLASAEAEGERRIRIA